MFLLTIQNFKFQIFAPYFLVSPFLDINAVPFSFLRSEEDDKTGLKQLVKDSDIWVNNTILTSFTKTAKSLKVYAAKIMWNVLLTRDDIMAMDHLKKMSVGFVKQFGHKNLEDVYRKLSKFRLNLHSLSSTRMHLSMSS